MLSFWLQVVLVNHGTASTSELLSGALHDNNRAKLLGTHTFGKGRTQRWRLLQDGSTLLVSSASITTPAHHEIHQVNPAEHVSGTSSLHDHLALWLASLPAHH